MTTPRKEKHMLAPNPTEKRSGIVSLQKKGITNRRAQQIIMDHMHHSATQSSMSSTATVPVLLQLDSTAPRTARTHDISHLRDRQEYLNPKIPASLIHEKDHVYETSFLPKDCSSLYHDADGLWYTKVFPSNTPSSRTDSVMLDAWITKQLEAYKKATVGGNEDLARSVEDLVPILSIALHEIVRQVTHHCVERGEVLEKIWKTYVELFDRVLLEMQAALSTEQTKTTRVHEVLLNTRKNLHSLKKSHPEQMQTIISDLEEQFTAKQKRVEEELLECESENQRLKHELRTVHGELELWYPSFPLYQDSYLKNHIPHYSHHGQHHVRHAADEEVPPEVAIAEDFKRLLAVLAPEKRQAIGKELTYVLKAASYSTKPEKQEKHGRKDKMRLSQLVADEQRHAEEEAKLSVLQVEISEQEAEIQDLKETIKILEAEEEAQLHLQAEESHDVGQDTDGLTLMQRRATAVAPAVGIGNLGKRHGNQLKVL
jgi:hypothetical protein